MAILWGFLYLVNHVPIEEVCSVTGSEQHEELASGLTATKMGDDQSMENINRMVPMQALSQKVIG